jgi:hypothetical protein
MHGATVKKINCCPFFTRHGRVAEWVFRGISDNDIVFFPRRFATRCPSG